MLCVEIYYQEMWSLLRYMGTF